MLNALTNIRLFFIGMIKVLFVSKFRSDHKNVHPKHKEVIILGNGPSLNDCLKTDGFEERLKEVDVVSVNYFTDSEIFTSIKPDYHIIAAPEFWLENVGENYKESRLKMFNTLAEKVDWDLVLFVPFLARPYRFWQDILSKNSNIKIVFYNIIPIEGGAGFTTMCFNKHLGMPRLHNIVGPSIMNMIWIGHQKIWLVGVEHSWLPLIHVTKDNVAMVGQPHFYDEDAKPEQMNKGAGKRKLHEILHKFQVTFAGYFIVQNYAEKRHVSIVNLTENSFIDAFPKDNLDIFINQSKS